MKIKRNLTLSLLVGIVLFSTLAAVPFQQEDSAAPPDHIVKLIFIHHSTGENWLRDDYGELGKTLDQNNYFVSDTNYGWGPDTIGDRTDIPNWTEWFASEGTTRYTNALFNENGQNAAYTRSLSDPGGENEIIVFKSCFPNSALEGKPGDPPDPEGWLSVGHAKYVYNEILRYFGTRPDKLFIVITAPPLSDGTYAENARAFNNWLLNDWLRENNYSLKNVAIFDFYNVLTSPDAHHRFANAQVEHPVANKNTLHYPSDDDHPSALGSQKATKEFVPLLNVFYHRWQNAGPSAPAAQNATVSPPVVDTAPTPISITEPAKSISLLDDLESEPPVGRTAWEGYFQDNTDTKLTCTPTSDIVHGGAASLKFDFDVTANSWATCGFYFDNTQNWSASQGISFYLHADRANLPFDVNLFGGSPGARTTYIFYLQTDKLSSSIDGWTLVEIRWDDILRTEWEDNPGTPFDPTTVTGFAIGLPTPEKDRVKGTIWLDDLKLFGMPDSAPDSAPAPTTAPTSAPAAVPTTLQPAAAPSEKPVPSKPNLPCVGSLILPLLIGLVWFFRSK